MSDCMKVAKCCSNCEMARWAIESLLVPLIVVGPELPQSPQNNRTSERHGKYE